MPELKQVPFEQGPRFSLPQLRELFGVTTTVERWIREGLLDATDAGKHGLGVRKEVEPAAVLRFVREHPEAYDWRRITDELLKQEAERVVQQDPPVSLDEIATRAGLDVVEVRRLARAGVFPTVAHFSARGGQASPVVRRSRVEATLAAIAAHRRRCNPLDALHALLRQGQAVPVHAPQVGIAREAVQAASLGTLLQRPPCPRCGARMIHGQDEDGGELWSCLACGTNVPIKDEARAASLAVDAAVARELRRGPGRPPKVREEAAG